MTQQEFDLFVIGAGSGGVRAARKASEFGAKVGIAENRFLGGTCVNVGCVPKKLFVYAAEFSKNFDNAKDFGWHVNASFNWQILRDNTAQSITRLKQIYGNILKDNNVTLFNNTASLAGDNQIMLDSNQTITAKKILIATGGAPIRPNIKGAEHCLISDDLFSLPELPKDILIFGGGYIGTEFSCILAGLGVNVTQNMRSESSFLRSFDNEISAHLKDILNQSKGITQIYAAPQTIIKQTDGSLLVTFENGTSWQGSTVLSAIGRKANLENLMLENAGLTPNDKGFLTVDETFQTSNKHIYAIGDTTGGTALTPIAIRQAMHFAYQQFHQKPCPFPAINPDTVPKAVFAIPPIGSVGPSQEQALQNYQKIRVYRNKFRGMKQSLGTSEEKMLMKLIVNDADDKVIACHIVGADAPEIIQLMGVIIHNQLTKAQMDETIPLHPVSAEELVTMSSAPEIISAS